MSGLFSLDATGNQALQEEAALNPIFPDQVRPGFFAGIPKALATAPFQAAGAVARAAELALSVPVAVGGQLWNPAVDYQQKYFETIDPYVKRFNNFVTPGPNETGTAANILGGFTQAASLLAAGGGNPALLIGSTGLSGAMSLTERGAGPDVSAVGGALEGAATGLGFKVPFLGKTLPMRVATGAVGFAGLNAGAVEAQRQLLLATGYSNLAAAYQPLDATDRAIDFFVGGLFGALHHYGAGGMPITADTRDAALALANARHAAIDTAPGFPQDVQTSAIQQKTIEQAMGQLLRDEPVTPPAALAEANFEPRPPTMTEADVPPILHQLDLERAVPDFSYVSDKALGPEDKAIETSFGNQLASDPIAAEQAYAKLPDAEGGKVLNTDIARELSSAYLADRTRSPAVHEPASSFVKFLFARRLTEAPKPGEEALVLFTGGGTGADKSTAINGVLGDIATRAQIVYDANMDNVPRAIAKINQALAAGKDATVAYVARDPVEALRLGALSRAARQEADHGSGRTLRLETHLKTHFGSRIAIEQIVEHFANNPLVKFHFIDNTRGKGNQALVSLSELPKIPPSEYNKVREQAIATLESELAAKRISRSIYEGFSGKPTEVQPRLPDQGTSGPVSPEVGPGVDRQPQAQRQGGNSDQLDGGNSVFTSAGRKIQVQPKIVEASSLVTSDQPAFPQDLQPRQRADRVALAAQVQTIASKLQPELLGPSQLADTGAPITGPDGVVESGNGRVMALRQVYANLPEKAAAYRAYLESQGYDLTGIKEPVLVRERVTPMDQAERQAFATEANQASVAAMSPVERAQSDARLLDSATMAKLHGEDLTTGRNAGFVRAVLDGLPVGERNLLVTSDGTLSKEGERRLQAAILAKAYGGTPESNVTLGRLLESTGDEIKGPLSALQDAAPAFARLRQMIADGKLGKEYDIAPAVLQAIEDVIKLKRSGSSLAEHLATQDMFSNTSLLSKAFYNADGTKLVSREKAGAELIKYATQAMHERTSQLNVFSTGPMSPTDILRVAEPKTGDMFGLRTAQGEGAKVEPAVEMAASLAEQTPNLRVSTGEINPDGSPETISVAEAMANGQQEIAQAEENAKAFSAAVNCANQRGV